MPGLRPNGGLEAIGIEAVEISLQQGEVVGLRLDGDHLRVLDLEEEVDGRRSDICAGVDDERTLAGSKSSLEEGRDFSVARPMIHPVVAVAENLGDHGIVGSALPEVERPLLSCAFQHQTFECRGHVISGCNASLLSVARRHHHLQWNRA